jgi:hypothetical protein
MTADGVKFRTVARRRVVAFLETFKVGHQDTLRQVHRARPAAFGALPAAFVVGLTEPRIEHLGYGIRQRDLEVQIALVSELSDNEMTVEALDALADDLVDALSADPHLLGDNTEQSPKRAASLEFELGGVFYPAVIVTLLGHIEEPKL